MRSHSPGFYCRLKLTLPSTPLLFLCENVLLRCDITGGFLLLWLSLSPYSFCIISPEIIKLSLGNSYCSESYFYFLINASGCISLAFSQRIRLQFTRGVTRGAVLSPVLPLLWMTLCLNPSAQSHVDHPACCRLGLNQCFVVRVQ